MAAALPSLWSARLQDYGTACFLSTQLFILCRIFGMISPFTSVHLILLFYFKWLRGVTWELYLASIAVAPQWRRTQLLWTRMLIRNTRGHFKCSIAFVLSRDHYLTGQKLAWSPGLSVILRGFHRATVAENRCLEFRERLGQVWTVFSFWNDYKSRPAGLAQNSVGLPGVSASLCTGNSAGFCFSNYLLHIFISW